MAIRSFSQYWYDGDMRHAFFMITAALLCATPTQHVFAINFTDVDNAMPTYDAIMALAEAGIIEGYANNKFQPYSPVNRAEALKILVEALYDADYIADVSPSTPFIDIPVAEWYIPYVEIARQNQAVDSPPATKNFYGSRQVSKAEFLKMLLILDRKNFRRYEDEGKDLAPDVAAGEWFYPYMTAGFSMNMLSASGTGALFPHQPLTREEVAQMMFDFLKYKANAHINSAEAEATTIIDEAMVAHGQGDDVTAGFKSFQSILLTYGLLDNILSAPAQALQKMAWASGKVLQGNTVEVQSLVEQAQQLSLPTVAPLLSLFQ